ncbi:MAG: hypothetical protein QXF67_02890 [Candidatus Anstonellales archaeon]
MGEQFQTDFASLSKAVAQMEKKATTPKKTTSYEPIVPLAFFQPEPIIYQNLLIRVNALESLLGKAPKTQEVSQRITSTKPIKEPSPKKIILDEIYLTVPPKPMEKPTPSMQANQTEQIELTNETDTFQPQQKYQKQRDDMPLTPEDLLGDIELARKEIHLSEAQKEIERLKREINKLKAEQEAKLSEEIKRLKEEAEEARKKEMEEAQRKLSTIAKSLEDEYERKLAKEIAKVKAAKTDSDISATYLSSSRTLSKIENYARRFGSSKKSLFESISLLKDLLAKKSSSISKPKIEKGIPSRYTAGLKVSKQKEPSTYPKVTSSPSKQLDEIDKLREDFEKKSREIMSLLTPKEEKSNKKK